MLDENGISYCAVGDTRQFLSSIPSDLDIVVNDRDASRLPPLVADLAHREGARLVQIVRHEPQAWYFVIAWSDVSGRSWFLHPDISCGYYENGRPLLSAAELLAHSRAAVDSRGNIRGFFLAAPADEFIYYFLKKTEKQSLNNRQGRHLALSYRADPSGAAVRLRRFWPGEEARLIARAAAADDWEVVRPLLPRLRTVLHRATPIPWRAQLREYGRILDRILRPTGLWVVFLGPDGSGKSTLLNLTVADISPAFRQIRRFHLRARLLPGRRPPRPNTEPHSQPVRRPLASVAWLIVNLVRCWLGYWLHIRPALVSTSLVAFDRYYHDVIVDPRRYRYGGPQWAARVCSALVPKPDLWIALDAPAAVIEARKKEVPLAEIERQRRAYRELTGSLRGGHVLDASPPPETLARDAVEIMLDYLEKRTARRHLRTVL